MLSRMTMRVLLTVPLLALPVAVCFADGHDNGRAYQRSQQASGARVHRYSHLAQAAETGKSNRGGDGGSVPGAHGGRGGQSAAAPATDRKSRRESDALIDFCVDYLKSNGRPRSDRYTSSDCIGYFEWLTSSREPRDGGGENGPSISGGVGGRGGPAGEGPGGGSGGAGGAGVSGGQGGDGGAGGAGR